MLQVKGWPARVGLAWGKRRMCVLLCVYLGGSCMGDRADYNMVKPHGGLVLLG